MTDHTSTTVDDLQLFDLQPSFAWEADWYVKRVNRESAERWFGDYHYSGTAGTAGGKTFGVYAGDCVAMVALGPTANKDGVAAKFGLQQWNGNVEIVRVAVHPDSPKNTASKSVAMVCDHVRRYWLLDWVFSYADTGQNHHGGIYQALNAVYVGVSPPERGYLVDGYLMHPRTVVSTFGTRAWPKVRELAERRGSSIQQVEDANTAKHTYVLPIGPPAVRRQIRQALKPYSMSYPKRMGVAT